MQLIGLRSFATEQIRDPIGAAARDMAVPFLKSECSLNLRLESSRCCCKPLRFLSECVDAGRFWSKSIPRLETGSRHVDTMLLIHLLLPCRLSRASQIAYRFQACRLQD